MNVNSKNHKAGQIPDKLYVDGKWVATSQQFEDLNPADGTVWNHIADANAANATKAIEAAQSAFKGWAGLSFTERSHFMLKVADEFERRKADLVQALQGEGGGWFGKCMFEAGYVAEVFRTAAATIYQPLGEILPSENHKLSLAVRRPIGVVSVITPWNFPALLTARGLAFTIAAGNTVVLKPSEETPYSGGLVFAEVFEAVGVPAGVLNVIPCSRQHVQEVGDLMVEHPYVKGIAFTGSTPVGRVVAAKAGAHLKKACIELGGKDALIVCDDADLERATSAANFGSFMHQGQICMAIEKILVQEGIYNQFLPAFVERAKKLKVGPPLADKSHVIGPLINDKQALKVKEQIEDAIAKGAKVELGGGVNGRFVEPTILTQINPSMKIYSEETFGPVVPVIPFKTDEEALAIANDSEYGLSSGVITQDEKRGLAIAEGLDTGMCHINCSPVNDEAHAPFGGSKSSGMGRYGGRWATETFTEVRWITLERGHRHYPPVF